ncbi:MAG: DNA-processing protein DprA, partial [Kiritimatiellae bacterium]|nr:DNA-processing protein DprA [Kiritimatiellia bacterium]
MTEREAYVAFNLTDRIGSVKLGQLVAECGSAVAAWERLPAKSSRSGGDIDWDAEFAKAAKYGVEIVTPVDPGYPRRLLDAPGHPLALYVKGEVAALDRSAVAIVGTRRATPYGRDQAFAIAKDLAADGWSVVSGLALGIDAEAHRGALAAGGTTVGVIGSGLDRFYPEENRALAREIVAKGGAVVSEFPFGREPDTQTFPQRNHVVAALASGVLAVEAPLKSGTLITTGIAADLGRVV